MPRGYYSGAITQTSTYMKAFQRSVFTFLPLLLLAFTSATLSAQDAPSQIQEDWFEHVQLIDLVHENDEVAIYFDEGVDRENTWMNQYLTDAWRYTKDVYGDFGEEGTDESRLYGVFHTGRYGGGHPGTYVSERHGYRNIIDVGAGPWDCMCGTPLDLVTHEIAHIVEGASFGTEGSPSFLLWGDSKWAEIYQYDVYDGLGMTVERDRWRDKMMATTDNIPVVGVNWFRDFWFPLYNEYGGSDVLRNYFKVLSENFPTVSRPYNGKEGKSYATRLNWGEFIHFWSGAAGADVSQLAADAFGWTPDYARQFQTAQRSYPLPYHEGLVTVDTFDQITLFTECEFAGDTASIGLGNYTLSELMSRGLPADALSSLKITEGFKVTLFSDDNFAGISLTLTESDSCLDETYNNQTESIRVDTVSTVDGDGDFTADGGVLTESNNDSPGSGRNWKPDG